jgi:predicted nucleic acid-binding Zn ribbon protein
VFSVWHFALGFLCAVVLGRRCADAARFIQNQASMRCRRALAAAVAIKGSGWHRKIHIIRC